MDADNDIDIHGQIDGIAWVLFRDAVPADRARFLIRGIRVSFERELTAAGSLLAAKIGKRLEVDTLRRYSLFIQTGGAPWTFYPLQEHGRQLAELLRGVPEAELEEAMTPYLDPIKRDLMRRGFPEGDAEAWCEEIAGASGLDYDDPSVAAWLAQS